MSRSLTDMIISHIEELCVMYNNYIFNLARLPSLRVVHGGRGGGGGSSGTVYERKI